MPRDGSEPGYLLSMGIIIGDKEMRGQIMLSKDSRVVTVKVESKLSLSPVEVEMALYQIAHGLAESTRTGDALKIVKDVWT